MTVEVTGDQNQLCLSCDMSGLLPLEWPQYRGLHRADEIWRSTCLELFMAARDEQGYLELNLSPCGNWNCYSFTGYRQGMSQSSALKVEAIQSAAPGQLEASVSCTRLSLPLVIGPTAVAAKADGELRYFALQHGQQPDFHDMTLHRRINHLINHL